jgi:hypothetical protein
VLLTGSGSSFEARVLISPPGSVDNRRYGEKSSERLARRNGYRGLAIVIAENRDGLEVPRLLPGRPESRKVLRIPDEPLIGRVSATEYFQGAFGQKAALSAIEP